jgi:hypothetical protein
MKIQGYWIRRAVIIVFCAFIVLFMGNHIISSNPLRTVTAVLTTTAESMPVSGIVVRDENIFPLPPGLIEFTAAEGERVSSGQTLAVSFRNDSARQNSLVLAEKTERRALLSYISAFSGIASDKLDAELRFHTAHLLSDASLGNPATLLQQSADVKVLLFHQSYSYEGAAILLPRIQTLNEDISVLSASLADSSSVLSADSPGLFSALTDGLENVWTPESVRRLSVSDFYQKSESRSRPSDDSYGRLIRGWSWRLVCLLPAFQAQTLSGSAALRFSDGFSHRLGVEYVSPENNGECAVVFYTDRYINRVISERRMQGELVFHEYEGVRIPSEGLRMDSDGYFVYCLLLGRVVRKDVDLFDLERDNYYLAVHHPASADALLPGDEIIVAGKDLFDGRVMKR